MDISISASNPDIQQKGVTFKVTPFCCLALYSLFAVDVLVHRVDHVLVVRELVGRNITGGCIDKLRDAENLKREKEWKEEVTRKVMKTKSKHALLWRIAILTFFLSAILDNLTLTQQTCS